MAIDLVSRAEWGARPAKGSYTTLRSTKGVKIHYTGSRVDPAILDDHDPCARLVRQVQDQHINGNGWIDIGYSLAVCPHRKVFVGRGPNRLPAANGLNSGHYAVLGLVGNSGLVQPPDGMLHGIVDAIEYLREVGGAGREIKGHRDGYATACPGEPLYAWVRRGAPRPASTPTAEPWMEKIMQSLPLLRAGAGARDDDPLRWDVKTVFYLLHARGYGLGGGIDDTKFTPALEDAVKAFQRAKKLRADGIVGPQTWAALLRVTP